MPVVVVEGDLSRAPWTVGVDQVAGAELATEHLLVPGSQRGRCTWPAPSTGTEARARLAGWQRVRARRRAPAPGSRCWATGPPRAATNWARSLAKRKDVTAVFVANDQMAIGVLRALWEAGRSVPDDVQRRRLRRHPRGGLPDPAAHHRPAGLRRRGAARHRDPPGRHATGGQERRRPRWREPPWSSDQAGARASVPAPHGSQEEGRDPLDANVTREDAVRRRRRLRHPVRPRRWSYGSPTAPSSAPPPTSTPHAVLDDALPSRHCRWHPTGRCRCPRTTARCCASPYRPLLRPPASTRRR